MGLESIRSKVASFRVCNVSGCKTELLEASADDPELHVLFIPGNPGVVMYYKEFVESLYEQMEGRISITAVGHLSQSKEDDYISDGFKTRNVYKGQFACASNHSPQLRTRIGLLYALRTLDRSSGSYIIQQDWANGRLFSLQEQIDHKMDFIREEMQNIKVPMLLVGHSIGSYICVEMFKRLPEEVSYCIGLYPFLTLNLESKLQSLIKNISQSLIVSVALSAIVASLGLLPIRTARFMVMKSIGKSWSKAAVEATCSYMLKYHTMRNVLYMAMTEFQELKEETDWTFLRSNSGKFAFLFGIDDHWGPLQMHLEMSKRVPEIPLSIEREGHTHSFCCTEAGSRWVAQHVATLIKNNEPFTIKLKPMMMGEIR